MTAIIDIVGRDYTNDKATDFNAILTSIKAKKPDGVFYGGMYAQGAGMKRQISSAVNESMGASQRTIASAIQTMAVCAERRG